MYTNDKFRTVVFESFRSGDTVTPKIDFKLREKVSHWSSAQGQDYFTQTVLDGKKQGYFVELGSKHPFYKNNTFVMEKIYDWRGLPIDWDIRYKKVWNRTRTDGQVVEDATKLDYTQYIPKDIKVVDYLSADLENFATLPAVKKFHEDGYLAKVVTYEHDFDLEESREHFRFKGYHLMMIVDEGCEIEDWWVHPDHIDNERFELMKSKFNQEPKRADGGIFNEFFE
tara:strand:+ start:1216 stop:1893 length:678 start_codon:yes stop_codon:yes gene_type:complete